MADSILKIVCSYCLQTSSNKKVCGKCSKRVYCSSECQKKDWTEGQVHKNWCGLVAEEGADYEVCNVIGKGVGLFALRDFAKYERIMVDRIYSEAEFMESGEKKFADLMPYGTATLKDKFVLNSIGFCDNNGERSSVVGVRISRVNHGCDNNTEHFYENEMKVIVMIASRDISKGEELTFQYKRGREGRPHLLFKWGIICGIRCICWKQDGIFDEITRLDNLILECIKERKLEEGIGAVDMLIKTYEKINNVSGLAKAYYDGFQVCVMRADMVEKGVEYINKYLDLNRKFRHPESPYMEIVRRYSFSPQIHVNYLAIERDELAKMGFSY
jgi:hypothetical protein